MHQLAKQSVPFLTNEDFFCCSSLDNYGGLFRIMSWFWANTTKKHWIYTFWNIVFLTYDMKSRSKIVKHLLRKTVIIVWTSERLNELREVWFERGAYFGGKHETIILNVFNECDTGVENVFFSLEEASLTICLHCLHLHQFNSVWIWHSFRNSTFPVFCSLVR